MHDDFKCLSPRDYVDTKSWLAYEQNPCSTHWVRIGSCHRETSLSYDILSAITWLWADTNIINDYHVNPTSPRRDNTSMLRDRGCTTLPQPVQSWVAVMSPAWLGSTIGNMTRYLHRASMTQQHCRQHDLTCYITSRPSCLGSTITSMTQWRHHTASNIISATPLSAWLNSDITQWLDRQHQQYMISAANKHADSSYWYYSLIYLVHDQCKHLIALLGTSMMHLHFKDSHLRTLDSWVNFFWKI
jgi:hypothetical protein